MTSSTRIGVAPDSLHYDGFESVDEIKAYIRERTDAPAMYAKTMLFASGIDAFIDIDRALSDAKKSIKINVFIWSNDSTGLRIAERLIEAHARGVKVEVNVDKIGSLVMGNHYVLTRWRLYLIAKLLPRVLAKAIHYRVSWKTIGILLSMMRDASAIYALEPKEVAKIENISQELISDEMFLKMHDVLKIMQQSGITLHINANAIRRIDHSKAVLVDENLSYIGGMNMSDVCSGGFDTKEGWCGKVEINYHKDYWLRLESRDILTTLDHYYFSSPAPDSLIDTESEDKTEVLLLRNVPGFVEHEDVQFSQKKQTTFVIEFLIQIAKKHIVIEHAYLMNDNIGKLLADAANRGVEIEIIRSGKQHITTETANNRFLRRVRSLIRQHRRSNFRIRRHPHILHSKVIAVDDFMVMGSANISLESLLYHDELSLLVHNNELQRQILVHLKTSLLESKFKRFLKGRKRKYSKELPLEAITKR